jgi:hypothetical protein
MFLTVPQVSRLLNRSESDVTRWIDGDMLSHTTINGEQVIDSDELLRTGVSLDDKVRIFLFTQTGEVSELALMPTIEVEEPFGYTLVQIRLTDLRKLIGNLSPFVNLSREQAIEVAINAHKGILSDDHPYKPIEKEFFHLIGMIQLMKRLEAIAAKYENEAR